MVVSGRLDGLAGREEEGLRGLGEQQGQPR